MEITEKQNNWHFRLHTQKQLESWLTENYFPLRIYKKKDGSCFLEGQLPDLSAFYGIMLLLRDTGVVILSLKLYKVDHDV